MTPTRRQLLAGASALTAQMTIVDSQAATAASRSLLVLGDWGRAVAPYQYEVAAQMNIAAAELDCAGVIAVGDNFYEDGVQSVDDPKWRNLFEDVYTGTHLRPLPWYVALGNHDYGGSPQAQVDYTGLSDRWHMPARYFKVAGAGIGMPEMDLFIIDTNTLIAENALGDDPLNINVRSQSGDAQLAWLDRELAASAARFRIVAGHHTLFSGGSTHGDSPDLIANLLPVLTHHGVTVYVNGHDHDLQHIIRDGIHFVCAGAGSEARPVIPVEGTQFCVAQSGFGILTAGERGLELQFRDYKGDSCYHALLA